MTVLGENASIPSSVPSFISAVDACADNDHKSYILHFRKCGVSSAAAYASLCDDSHTGWYSHATDYNCYHGYAGVYVR